MRLRTVVVLAVIVLALGGVALLTVSDGDTGGTLTERWTSDTARNTTFNHHAVGADAGIVVAPIAAVPNSGFELTRTSCTLARLDPGDGAVEWRTTTPPDTCFLHALTEPTIADVDGDGRQEVVAATTMNATVVYDAATGTEQFRIPLSTYGYGPPTVANLTADPGPEIATVDIDGAVVVADGTNGSVQWRGTVSGPVWNAPIVNDLDADGTAELALGTNDETVAFDGNGTRLWSVDKAGIDLVVAQTDDDAPLEVIATDDTAIRALDGSDGSEEWETPTDSPPQVTAVGDGNGDGTAEVYLSRPGSIVRALDATDGSKEWTAELEPDEYTSTPPPVLGDLTGDGDPELVAATENGLVAVLDPTTGAELASYERDVPIQTFPTLTDVTGNGNADVLVRYGDGRVTALTYEE